MALSKKLGRMKLKRKEGCSSWIQKIVLGRKESGCSEKDFIGGIWPNGTMCDAH